MLTSWILEDLGGQRLLALRHGVEGNRGTGLRDGLNKAGILQRKEAFWDGDIHQNGQHQGAHRHHQVSG